MNFINRLKDIFSIEELKNKILLTIGLIAVYRFMAAVPLPGIDPLQLTALKESTSGGLLGLLNAFTGGAFARASVMRFRIYRNYRKMEKVDVKKLHKLRDG